MTEVIQSTKMCAWLHSYIALEGRTFLSIKLSSANFVVSIPTASRKSCFPNIPSPSASLWSEIVATENTGFDVVFQTKVVGTRQRYYHELCRKGQKRLRARLYYFKYGRTRSFETTSQNVTSISPEIINHQLKYLMHLMLFCIENWLR